MIRSVGREHHARLRPFLALVATLALGLGVRAALSGCVAKYLGVALWATLVYFFVLFLAPETSARRAFVVCVLVSFAVELFQLTPVPKALHELHPAFALVLGTTFNALDLPAYVAGAALGALCRAPLLAAPALR